VSNQKIIPPLHTSYKPSKTLRLKKSGFTLIEVIIAIAILATSTITLLGVQSAITRRATVDNLKIRAILAARDILAAAEITDNPPNVGTIEGTPDRIRDQILGLELKESASPASQTKELPLLATLIVTEVPLPISDDPPKLIRYELIISWGDGNGQSVTVNYFIPG